MNVNATHFENIPALPKNAKKRTVNAIIETPRNSPNKYALKPEYGLIALHDVLPNGMHWPYDFGFVPSTLAPDGDPLDILVITETGLFAGCLATVRVVGAIRESKNGTENDRLIAVPPVSDGAPQPCDDYKDIEDLPKALLQELKQFLKGYSQRQGNKVKIKGVIGAADAMAVVAKTSRKYLVKRAGG